MISSLNVSVDTGSKGNNGSVYLDLGGREFLLDTNKNDFQPNASNAFIFGDNTNVKSPELQDPRSGLTMNFNDLNLFPTFVRSVSDNPWSVKRVNVIVREQDGRIAVFRRQCPNGQELNLGAASGRALHLIRLPEISSTFSGNATLALPEFTLAPGPFFNDFKATLVFIQGEPTVTCVLDPFTVNTEVGELTVEQVGNSSGTFDPTSGAMTLDLRLEFQLKNLTFGNPKGAALFHLTTNTSGTLQGSSRDPSNGAIRLVSETTVDKGALLVRGQTVQMTLDGTLNPIV